MEIDWKLLYFGEYDVVIIMDAPNDEAVMSLMLKVGSYGNVRTKTLKAFTAEKRNEDYQGSFITFSVGI